MAGIIFKIWFLAIVLPFIIIIEGYKMFKDLMNKKNWWGRLPYAILIILVILLIILLLKGYRW